MPQNDADEEEADDPMDDAPKTSREGTKAKATSTVPRTERREKMEVVVSTVDSIKKSRTGRQSKKDDGSPPRKKIRTRSPSVEKRREDSSHRKLRKTQLHRRQAPVDVIDTAPTPPLTPLEPPRPSHSLTRPPSAAHEDTPAPPSQTSARPQSLEPEEAVRDVFNLFSDNGGE